MKEDHRDRQNDLADHPRDGRRSPTLILHGDKDFLVPIQQAETMVARLKEAGVTAELVVRKGAAHGWKDMNNDLSLFADWYDKHLKK